ncbi:TetR/AcrR family transcriptional regulator [Ornithinimicrobium cryptoxanthini]|uniref:TetR/AcrR family transcriptional regulator n=1 Tax=Ornithinimicrobium cryptoxanthini TaxID=2934161 RepID=A0ABY4YJB0_9MICO|nr:TetR/AcrR family transcriptional regulator [Ornithinimicrobium cryptoxanthini]USQ76699.1 TetR/AcrR family transcriptional regulator [Ornithinimicrobium cryptoxanthini]
MSPRAPALPPDQRRAVIVTAALGILRVKGPSATTREIADAAGIAEGTLFRAFATKEDLIGAALEQAFEPTPLIEALAAIEPDQLLRERLVAAVTIIQTRYLEVFELLHAMGLVHPPDHDRRSHDTHKHDRGSGWQQQVIDQLVALVAPDAEQLRVPPAQLIEVVRLLTFAGSHPILTRGSVLAPDIIVDVLLDGTRKAR